MRAVMSAVLISVLALGIAAGCARRAYPYTDAPRVDQRRLRNLHRIASAQMGCPPGALQAMPLSDRVWQVSGCNQVREFAIIGRGRGRYRGARWSALVPLPQRASNELACGAHTLAITAPSVLERGVSGCGRSATYTIVCDHLQCVWVMTAHAGLWADSGASAPSASASTVEPSTTIVVVPQP